MPAPAPALAKPQPEGAPNPRRDPHYLLLAAVLLPLRFTPQLALVYLASHFLPAAPAASSAPIYTRAAPIWAAAEVCFGIYHYYLRRKISPPAPNPPPDYRTLQTAFIRLLQTGLASLPSSHFNDDSDDDSDVYDPEKGRRPYSPAEPIIHLDHDDPRAIDFRNKFSTWFSGVPWSHVKRGDLEKWLYWSCFNARLPPPDQIPPHNAKVLREAVKLLEMRCGTKLEPGTTPSIQPLCLTVDDIKVTHRPLAWYLLVWSLNQTLRLTFERKWNVRFERWGELDYMLRIPEGYDAATGPLPILFLHGLGLGLAQYQKILTNLLEKLPDTPVVVPIQPHISQDIFHPRFLTPLSRPRTVELITGLLEELNFDAGVMCMSHSNGSYAHAWLLKDQPFMIRKSCFVDPVTFCSWEGDVCYNFVYRPPLSTFHLMLQYFVSTELGVANLIQRHFDWTSNSLFFEEIPEACDPKKTIYILGGQDSILSAERVRKYLCSHGVREGLKFYPEFKHGEALLTGGPAMDDVFNWIQSDHQGLPNEA